MDTRAPILYLTHRIPYPPNKGDKVRSFNILRQLARNHRVFLGTFVDHADDVRHVARLAEWCEDSHVVHLGPRLARVASLRGLLFGEALSLAYYRDAGLRDWVGRTVRQNGIRDAVAFSGPMAQYLDIPGIERRIIDFCDVDSAKWAQYATRHHWPMAWLYRREGERLLAFERSAALYADASVFVTDAEADLFRCAAPEAAARVVTIRNGVDVEFYSPTRSYPNPFPAGDPVVVFSGAMDYWPNIDGVVWFVREILPRIRATYGAVRFYIVGMNPGRDIRALEGPGVVVTGTVPDVRPWLAHADLVAVPLRVARGVQNKVLEAMSMARPVVVSSASAVGLVGRAGREFDVATSAEQFADRICSLLADPAGRSRIGACARDCVETHCSWQANLTDFDALLIGPASSAAVDGRFVMEVQS